MFLMPVILQLVQVTCYPLVYQRIYFTVVEKNASLFQDVPSESSTHFSFILINILIL
jgi:hypothetical protein